MKTKHLFLTLLAIFIILPASSITLDSILVARSLKKSHKIRYLKPGQTFLFHFNDGKKFKGKYKIIDAHTLLLYNKKDTLSVSIYDIKQINALATGWKIGGILFTGAGGFGAYITLKILLGAEALNVNSLGAAIIYILMLSLVIIIGGISAILLVIGLPMFFLGKRFKKRRWKFEITPES